MLCAQFVGFSRLVRSFGIFDGACPISERPARAPEPVAAG
jgi:hypothetical protein